MSASQSRAAKASVVISGTRNLIQLIVIPTLYSSFMKLLRDIWISETTLAADKARIEGELVDLLYGSSFNIVSISMATSFFCGVLAAGYDDLIFLFLAFSAAAIGILRYANNVVYHRQKQVTGFPRWRMRHARCSLLYAFIMSVVGVYPFAGGPADAQVFSVALLISYCAGAVSRLAVHPQIAILCITLASAPSVVVLLIGDHSILHKLLGFLILSMTSFGIQIIRGTYFVTRDMLVSRADLAELAGNDSLTGLANRFTLDIRLRSALLNLEKQRGHVVTVYFIDLDHFKAANDTYGHPAGDAILVEVGERLRKLMPESAFAARRGGDEFVVVEQGNSDRSKATHLSNSIANELSAAYIVAGQSIIIGASVGVAISNDPSISPLSLIANADRALYEAKRRGRGTVEFYS